MAEIKVSQLPEASQINDNDLIMIVQGGTNKKITKENCQFASGDEVAIGTTEPVGEEKIWINPEEVSSGSGSYISNVYSDAQDKAYSCHYINDINTYSTSETDTGKRWIDGKKIYRKTFTGSYNSGAELLSGVDTLVNHYGTAFISGATRCVPYIEVYNGNMFDAQFRVLNNKIVSEFMNNGSTTSSNISMTFEYTKTTD